jgi:hypothetical protein
MHGTQQRHVTHKEGKQLKVYLFRSLPIRYGVPQGSVLSQLLLIINVYDFAKCYKPEGRRFESQ